MTKERRHAEGNNNNCIPKRKKGIVTESVTAHSRKRNGKTSGTMNMNKDECEEMLMRLTLRNIGVREGKVMKVVNSFPTFLDLYGAFTDAGNRMSDLAEDGVLDGEWKEIGMLVAYMNMKKVTFSEFDPQKYQKDRREIIAVDADILNWLENAEAPSSGREQSWIPIGDHVNIPPIVGFNMCWKWKVHNFGSLISNAGPKLGTSVATSGETATVMKEHQRQYIQRSFEDLMNRLAMNFPATTHDPRKTPRKDMMSLLMKLEWTEDDIKKLESEMMRFNYGKIWKFRFDLLKGPKGTEFDRIHQGKRHRLLKAYHFMETSNVEESLRLHRFDVAEFEMKEESLRVSWF